MAISSASAHSSVVLVIDPDPAAQREMRDRLTELGYTARAADDYVSALDIISNAPPDVVLVSGYEPHGEDFRALHDELDRWGIPLLDLAGAYDELSTDPLPENAPVADDADLKLRVDAALRARSLQDALVAENARLNAERLHDPLTGLYNRRYIMIRTEEEVLRSSRRGHPLACMLIDMDGFVKVNEEWGHQTGDAVLRDMAHVLTRTLRGSDIACRYREDQFMVLLTDTDADGAQIAANRVRDAISSYNFSNASSDTPLRLTASVGVAYWQPSFRAGQSSTWEPQLLGLAERALKAAKQSGPNRLVILQAT
jgi:diguanylate cyclase (GGDEF)-like protein